MLTEKEAKENFYESLESGISIWTSMEIIPFNDLIGKSIINVKVISNLSNVNLIVFETLKDFYVMGHGKECCEVTFIKEIDGDFEDLLNTPILKAEENTSKEKLALENAHGWDTSSTWTFYKLGTIKGYVDITWHCISNGWYSESVDLYHYSKNRLKFS